MQADSQESEVGKIMGYIPPTIEEAMSLEKTLLWYKRQRNRFAIVVGGGILLSLILIVLVLYLKILVNSAGP